MFEIALRSTAIYLFIVFSIRFFGKKELSQLSVIDLVFVLLISNSVQNAMVGANTSLLGGVVAAGSLFIINWILKNILFKYTKLNTFLQGSPLMLIYQGKTIQRHLLEAKISKDEIEAAVREHGTKDIASVDIAVLEVDGSISIISDNYHHKTTKKRRVHKSLSGNM